MDSKGRIYYGLGQLAYLVANSDGSIQNSEVNELHEIVVNELKKHNPSFEYSEIIFNVLSDTHPGFDVVYNSAIKELNSVKSYLTIDIVKQIENVLNKVGESYKHTTLRQKEIIEKSKRDLMSILEDG